MHRSAGLTESGLRESESESESEAHKLGRSVYWLNEERLIAPASKFIAKRSILRLHLTVVIPLVIPLVIPPVIPLVMPLLKKF